MIATTGLSYIWTLIRRIALHFDDAGFGMVPSCLRLRYDVRVSRQEIGWLFLGKADGFQGWKG